MKPFTLRDFVRESNRIEGISYSGPKLNADIEAHEYVLSKEILTRPVIESFALRVTRGVGKLRSRDGMDVRVGQHLPPRGGESLVRQYEAWLRDMPRRPFEAHIAFEKLHPFMDGNGRTGRVLWLWQVGGIENAPLGFLHHWYYATLQVAQEGGMSFEGRAVGCSDPDCPAHGERTLSAGLAPSSEDKSNG